jgi:predicted metalloprotease with PDZ domain
VAFLYDLTLRYQSKNRNTIDNLFRELMRKHGRGTKREDGNRAAIGAMNALLGSSEFTNRYVKVRMRLI